MKKSSIPKSDAAGKASWREVLPIHPAAELFPLMSPEELQALGEDIKRNGLTSPIVLWSPGAALDKDQPKFLLDGRNRLDAMKAVGLSPLRKRAPSEKDEFVFCNTMCGEAYRRDFSVLRLYGKKEVMACPSGKRSIVPDTDPHEFVVSANIHRRHLTAEQKRELIAKLLKATPEKSDRQIAKTVKADHKTVGAIRVAKERRGEIPHVEKRTDIKGRSQPARKVRQPGERRQTPTESQQGAEVAVAQPSTVGTDSNDAGAGIKGKQRIAELEHEVCRLKLAHESEVEELTQAAAKGERIISLAMAIEKLIEVVNNRKATFFDMLPHRTCYAEKDLDKVISHLRDLNADLAMRRTTMKQTKGKAEAPAPAAPPAATTTEVSLDLFPDPKTATDDDSSAPARQATDAWHIPDFMLRPKP